MRDTWRGPDGDRIDSVRWKAMHRIGMVALLSRVELRCWLPSCRIPGHPHHAVEVVTLWAGVNRVLWVTRYSVAGRLQRKWWGHATRGEAVEFHGWFAGQVARRGRLS